MSTSTLGWLRLPSPAAPVAGWQVSPVVDAAAYALSWLWVLVPLLLCGPKHPTDYYGLFALVLTVNTLHRHFGLPLVYLDREVYARHVTRFSVVPLWMGLGVVATPLASRFTAPVGFFGAAAAGAALAAVALVAQVIAQDVRGFEPGARLRVAAVAPYGAAFVLGLAGAFVAAPTATPVALALACAAVSVAYTRAAPAGQRAPVFAGLAAVGAVLAVVGAVAPDVLGRWPAEPAKLGVLGATVFAVQVFWGLWHVTMQKVGIFRMYAAKQAEVPPEARTPIAVDRALVWGFFPAYFFALAPAHRAEIVKAAGSAKGIAGGLMDTLTTLQPWLGGPAVALAAASVAWFFWWEWKTTRLRCTPRVVMGLGTVALNLAVVIWPVKGVLAYTFSHGLEYLVFVWAFQRRRYAFPLAHRPLLQRVLARPVIAYGGFLLLVGGFFFYTDYGHHYGLPAFTTPIFGLKLGTWVGSWAVWEALFHYYQDGFLWKMRLPSVRAAI